MVQKYVQQIVIENFGSCNMRCTYCFPEHMWQREGRFQAMPEEMYQGILERSFPRLHPLVPVSIYILLAENHYLQVNLG